jgi:hypothetical protein
VVVPSSEPEPLEPEPDEPEPELSSELLPGLEPTASEPVMPWDLWYLQKKVTLPDEGNFTLTVVFASGFRS